jgi:hypothetical protein
MFLGVECGRCVRLAILPPSVSQLSIQCGIFNVVQPHRRPRPVTGISLLYFTLPYLTWFSARLPQMQTCHCKIVFTTNITLDNV